VHILVGIILLLTTAFNVVAWPTFYRRVAKDSRARDAAGKPTAFLRVHAILVTIALAIALVSLVAAVLVFAGLW
jgi:uncharacterized membrane protein